LDVLVDSNVILDVLTEDRDWYGWSSERLVVEAERHNLLINPFPVLTRDRKRYKNYFPTLNLIAP
jgi:hypothetical protein